MQTPEAGEQRSRGDQTRTRTVKNWDKRDNTYLRNVYFFIPHWAWSLTSWQQFWTDQFYIHNKHLCHLKVDLHVLLWKTYRTRRPDSHNNNCIPPRLLPLARPSLIKLQSSLLTSSQCYIATFHLYIRISFQDSDKLKWRGDVTCPM